MNYQSVFSFLLLFVCFTTFSQIKDKNVLLTVDGTPTTIEEFNRVYSKNLNLVKEENQKDKTSYLDLFINYKLKVKEAIAQQLDQDPAFVKEYAKYRDQLSQNYLYEQKITDDITKEAYDRMQEQIKASHILILVSEDAMPADTLKAYNKINDIRQKAINKEDFETLAKTYSEDPSVKENGGNLGYFSAFGMVYPFETAAYNTQVGEVSNIVRTRYGYHILKVFDRKPLPEEITAAHIMIAHREQVKVEDTKRQIDDIYKRLQQGEDFVTLVEQFSQETASAKREGIIGRFGAGKLNAPAFEEAAFALENPGDYSEPVLTDFGWHIVRLIERHPKESYESMKEELTGRIKGTDRGNVIIKSAHDRIKEKYHFTANEKTLPYFISIVTDSIYKGKWTFDKNSDEMKNTAFSIGNEKITYLDFAEYLNERQSKIRNTDKSIPELINGFYKTFEENTLKEFFKTSLAIENKEYANLLQEYHDGLLIYDLMQKNIWEKTKNDTIGLANYFEKTKANYKWETRVDALIGSTTNNEIIEQVVQMLQQGKTEEDIKATFNTEEKVNISFTKGIYELGHTALPKDFSPQTGIQVYEVNNNDAKTYVAVKVNQVLPATTKNLDEVRGRVTGDYQNHLEQEWMKTLRNKYKVEINKKALKKL